MAESESNLFILESQNEEWRVIPDFPDYEVSSYGRVRHTVATKMQPAGYVLVPFYSNGYPRVCLQKNKRTYKWFVHRLVALAFFGPPPAGQPHVNHKNGNRGDSFYGNLEWCSPKENTHHADVVLGHKKRGDAHPDTKFTTAILLAIHDALMNATPPTQIMRMFNISETQLYRIKHRQIGNNTLNGLPTNYPRPNTILYRGNSNSKLTVGDVKEIKLLLRQGHSLRKIAQQYGVGETAIFSIKHGITWGYVEID